MKMQQKNQETENEILMTTCESNKDNNPQLWKTYNLDTGDNRLHLMKALEEVSAAFSKEVDI